MYENLTPSLKLFPPENKDWMVPAEPGRLDGLVGHITTLVELLEMSSTAWGDRVPRIEGREYSYCNSGNKPFNFMHIQLGFPMQVYFTYAPFKFRAILRIGIPNWKPYILSVPRNLTVEFDLKVLDLWQYCDIWS